MPVYTKRAVDIFAPTDAGGAERSVLNGETQVWGTEVERGIEGAAVGRVDTVAWSSLSGIAGERAGQPAIVYGPDAATHTDPVTGLTVPNEGIYAWSASPAGWRRVGEVPSEGIIHAANTGAGTPDAVQATTIQRYSTDAYAALISVNFAAANAGAMTLSINGEPPRAIVTNTGEPLPADYVQAGMAALVQIDEDGAYRLFSYGDADAVLAAVEAWADEAKDARDEAVAAAAGVDLPPVTANTMLIDNAAGDARESKTFAEVRQALEVPSFDDLIYIPAWELGVPGDGSDQTAALQALCDGPLVPAEGARIGIRGNVVVSSLDLFGRRNIRFEGMGGRGAGAAQRSYLTTNAGAIGASATVIDCGKTMNVSFEKIVIQALEPSFNGRLLSYGMTAPVPGDDSALMALRDVMMIVNGTGIGLWLYGATLGQFEQVQFGGTGRKVHMQDVDDVGFSNQLAFKGCSFIGSNLHPLFGSFEGLHLEDCNFQASPDGMTRVLLTSLNKPFKALTMVNNSLYDSLSGGIESIILPWGEAVAMFGNKFSNINGSYIMTFGSGGGSHGDPQTRGVRGVSILGNQFDTGAGATTPYISFAGTAIDKTNVRGIVVGGNSVTNSQMFSGIASVEQMVILPNSIYGSGAAGFGSHFTLIGLPTYADRAAAIADDMTTDQVYIDTGSGRRLLGVV